MEFSINKSIEILERTPRVLIQLTNNLSGRLDNAIMKAEKPGQFLM